VLSHRQRRDAQSAELARVWQSQRLVEVPRTGRAHEFLQAELR
jgi:hypothetical protein